MRTIEVYAPYSDAPSQIDGFGCRGLGPTPPSPDCQLAFTGLSTFRGGTITGDEHYELAGFFTADGKLTYDGTAYITGAIAGCGAGSFILDIVGGYIDYAHYDVQANAPGGVGGSAPGFNYWRLRPGSGTGQLTNLVSGEGETNWRDYTAGAIGLIPPEGIGLYTGTITCRT